MQFYEGLAARGTAAAREPRPIEYTGEALLAFASTIPADDLEIIRRAVEEDCERVAEEGSQGFLLDANVIVAAFNEEPRVLERLQGIPTERIFVPVVALGELHFGASKSRRTEANTQRIEEFTAASNVVDVDTAGARLYGKVRDELRRIGIGRPIPENDVWSAATALRADLTLVTHGTHFDSVDGLRVER